MCCKATLQHFDGDPFTLCLQSFFFLSFAQSALKDIEIKEEFFSVSEIQ